MHTYFDFFLLLILRTTLELTSMLALGLGFDLREQPQLCILSIVAVRGVRSSDRHEDRPEICVSAVHVGGHQDQS